MPSSPLKRPSAGGRLGRLFASLRPPARAGPLPVQTGFPTSLADLVVKNHGRLNLKNPRPRHRPSAAAERTPPLPELRREVVTVQNAVARRPEGAAFSIRPEVLAVGGAVALALVVVWSKWPVAAATAASVALVWIESVRSSASRRRPLPETTTEDLASSCGRGIREPETPRSSCAASDTGSEVSSLWAADDPIAPRRKEKRRSLRKLIATKLRNGKRSKHPDADEAAGPVETEPVLPAPAVDATPPEAIAGERCRQIQRGAFPSSAFVPIILVGLVAGKLPAVALTVLCAVFFSSVDRVPSS